MHLHREDDRSLSQFLTDTASTIDGEDIAIREIVERVGESGMMLFAVFLTLPFLVPVSVPGISTVFGLLIILIGLGVILDRPPWLPGAILERRVASKPLGSALGQGAKIVERFEKFLHPRWGTLVDGLAVKRFNGFMLVFAGVLLMAPFGFVPFSNTLPGLAILALAVGMLERDGVFIAAGYALTIATLVYFTVLLWGAWAAGGMILG